MAFEARIYIQGAGVHLPDKQRHLVLFPNQEWAEEQGLRDLNGKSFCRHHAVVQLSSHALSGQSSDLWTTFDVEGQRIRVEATPPPGRKIPTKFSRQVGQKVRVPGLPDLEDLVGRVRGSWKPSYYVNPAAIPGDASFDPDLLASAVELSAGSLSPATEYEGEFNLYGREKPAGRLRDETFASVVKVELGIVDQLLLRFKPLDGVGGPTEILLDPYYDEVEIWVRHFCDLRRPDPRQDEIEAEEPDLDFALNYALLESFAELLRRGLIPELPIPRISTSWVRGGPIGGAPANCGGTSGGKKP